MESAPKYEESANDFIAVGAPRQILLSQLADKWRAEDETIQARTRTKIADLERIKNENIALVVAQYDAEVAKCRDEERKDLEKINEARRAHIPKVYDLLPAKWFAFW
jgi:hypothetical protein